MSLEKILGQDQVKHILSNSLRKNQLAHAYLFFGPESIGKKRTAFELAKALNCLPSGPVEACDDCDSCRKIERELHPDIFLIKPTRSTPTAREAVIKIDEIRNLQTKLGYLPYEGRTKVAIIDDAEQLNIQAANSFLKTLEEPPDSTILILIVSNIHKLMPTILSRCQTIRFSPLPLSAIKQVLLQQSEIEFDPQELDFRVSRSKGQVKRALEEDILSLAEYRDELIKLIDLISFKNINVLFQWTKKMGREHHIIMEVLEEMQGLVRDMAFLRNSASKGQLINKDLEPQMTSICKRKSSSQWLKLASTIHDTQQTILANANLQLSLENMLLNFCEAA